MKKAGLFLILMSSMVTLAFAGVSRTIVVVNESDQNVRVVFAALGCAGVNWELGFISEICLDAKVEPHKHVKHTFMSSKSDQRVEAGLWAKHLLRPENKYYLKNKHERCFHCVVGATHLIASLSCTPMAVSQKDC